MVTVYSTPHRVIDVDTPGPSWLYCFPEGYVVATFRHLQRDSERFEDLESAADAYGYSIDDLATRQARKESLIQIELASSLHDTTVGLTVPCGWLRALDRYGNKLPELQALLYRLPPADLRGVFAALCGVEGCFCRPDTLRVVG